LQGACAPKPAPLRTHNQDYTPFRKRAHAVQAGHTYGNLDSQSSTATRRFWRKYFHLRATQV
jgi:hypothetical protein